MSAIRVRGPGADTRLQSRKRCAVGLRAGVSRGSDCLAAQGSISNIVAAISIVYDRPFRVGDWVNLNGLDATVERLGLVSVRLRTL
jgi:hypothetical protein